MAALPAGDIVTMSGIFLVTRFTGFRAIRAGLTADTFLEVMSIQNSKARVHEADQSAELNERVEAMVAEGDIYTKARRRQGAVAPLV
jgi:DNA replication licensing factor MCM7